MGNGRISLDTSFGALLEAAQVGADWAWERIYDDLSPTILGYLRARGSPDAEGVCGEVFCEIVRDINRFEGDESGFRSWVFVIVHHRLLDDLRRRKRRPEAPFFTEVYERPDERADVEGDVVRRERERDLRRIIGELTEPQRDVLLLRIFGGLKIEEVAQVMGRRVGAVKALQRRALEGLRGRLADEGMYPSERGGRLPH